jgi:membrane protein YdbS with pleckstrin-like domain
VRNIFFGCRLVWVLRFCSVVVLVLLCSRAFAIMIRFLKCDVRWTVLPVSILVISVLLIQVSLASFP